MRRHLAYLKYVLRHKYYVYKYCRILKVPLHRALLHDWSKFLPSEWFPYARTFYKPDGSKQYVESVSFAEAWLKHQNRNPHHWQYWLITWDRGETKALEMPETYIREMLADWCGAGIAITGKLEVWDWYTQNSTKMILHIQTRMFLEILLNDLRTI